jgi:hypothetical protein
MTLPEVQGVDGRPESRVGPRRPGVQPAVALREQAEQEGPERAAEQERLEVGARAQPAEVEARFHPRSTAWRGVPQPGATTR